MVIVDADGRLDPSAPAYVAAHFENPSVGGVQGLVWIYNRGGPLTWLQDLEFSVYGHLFQAGRDDWGTAGMGGNGQFNRLSALEQVDDGRGPWRHRLTEDQDLGLRLIAAGWNGRQELRATVDQQGLPRIRSLLRQRTRWSQGLAPDPLLRARLRWHDPGLHRGPRVPRRPGPDRRVPARARLRAVHLDLVAGPRPLGGTTAHLEAGLVEDAARAGADHDGPDLHVTGHVTGRSASGPNGPAYRFR